jgi:menaquinone-dependent protoporphyrinogen oxidase
VSRIAVLYATREGHTRKVAEHIAHTIDLHGHVADPFDVRELPRDFDLRAYHGVIVAGSVHMGLHERELRHFVREHRAALEAMPSAFVSVSLNEAAVEDPARSKRIRDEAAELVRGMMEAFFAETGWRPKHAEPVAGALPYTHYGAVTRFAIKRLVGHSEGPTDTSRDYEFTDWRELERFVGEVLEDVPAGPPAE